MSDDLIWGIDLGGTKVECAVLNRRTYNVLARERIATERDEGYEHIKQQVRRLVDRVADAVGRRPDAVGIGMPGVPDPDTGILKNGNTVVLNGKPFARDMEALLGARILIANDANCFALAETHLGAVPEVCPTAKVVFGTVLGTGVGGGIVIDGKVLTGHHGIAGEWGHSYLDDSGGRCFCGNIGCIEQIISGTGLERFYAERSGQARKLKEIMTLLETDPHARATHDRLIAMFGKAISQIINILDPDVIVVGGGVSHVETLFTAGRTEIEKYIYNDRFEGLLVPPKLGDSAGVFGAAMLVAELR